MTQGPEPRFENPPARCDWLDAAERQFEAISELPSGWDSHGAAAPSPQLLGGAFDLLLNICRAAEVPKPHINPTRAGGIQFEWEKGGRHVEVEVTAERAATYFYQDERNRREEEGELFELESVAPLVRLVRAVYAED
jgi:hypothetical protein